MRWQIDDGERGWHLWFAWYPVKVNGQRVWWEWVARRTENVQGYLIHRYRIAE